MTKVELKTVSELLDKKFVVPLYQRGYRWEAQQVKDLLKDIDEFMRRHASEAKTTEDKGAYRSVVAEADDFYCLQPLAVKEKVKDSRLFSKQYSALFQETQVKDTDVCFKVRNLIENNVCWEVIDGQQRLTTIFIILQYLKVTQSFDIEFDRWKSDQREEKGEEKLANVVSEIANKIEHDDNYKDEETIDRWHIFLAYKEVISFFDKKSDDEKAQFRDTLLNKVQFIWYESDEENPVKVFTRLNIGKIALTNSELIKALFLNRSNFAGADFEKIRLRQMEIASRWDEIETTLQNDEFWMFIHEQDFDKPTRIDYIFDLISDMKRLDEYMPMFKNMKEEDRDKKIGKDTYRTFRYFNEYFNSKEAQCAADKGRITLIEQCWKEVDFLFAAFKEWFGNLTLYHYVGFLVACGTKVQKILTLWEPQQNENSTKARFISSLKEFIKVEINACADLGQQYEMGTGPSKTVCRPLLLLHNIQSAINQNAQETAKYGIASFYKFPFHLFKAEKWNVEHIDSNTENSLDTDKDREEWLKSAWCFLRDEEVREKIIEYFRSDVRDFDGLHTEILKTVIKSAPLDDKAKNEIGNFVLLDESTNKSYRNAIFPVKKMILMGKTQGVQYQFKEKVENGNLKGFEIVAEPLGSKTDVKWKTAFVPPVTLRAFLKAFNPVSNNPWSWDADDAKAYRSNIYETLKEFGVINDQKDANSSQGK